MEYKNRYTVAKLIEMIEEEIILILRTNLYEVGLKEGDILRLRQRKNNLRDALNNSGTGDLNAKIFLKHIIADILKEKIKITPKDYNDIMPFNNRVALKVRTKFDILIYFYIKDFKKDSMEAIIKESKILNNLDYMCGYSLKEEDIERLFDEKIGMISEDDKFNIIIQRIYSEYRGLGILDDIRDMNIDGVSGGVSGSSGSYESLWIFYKGITIHLPFLSFESEKELERICMNIYRYNNPGQLSKSKGFIVNEMKDGSRVVVVRPPFSESFAFFVRKFDNVLNKNINELITDSNKEDAVNIIECIIKGCQVTGITGSQGCGKTTLLMSLIDFIPAIYTLRIQEMAFELHLREVYPNRNILTFRETEDIKSQSGLDLQKKTDGAVNVLGEVASMEVASYLIQMSQVGSLFTVFTHHAKTTENLIKYMRNSLLSLGLFKNERVACEQVIDAIRFDIHMEKDVFGHRYIERITEIEENPEKGYVLRDILVCMDGKYIINDKISKKTSSEILKRISKNERWKFEKYLIQ